MVVESDCTGPRPVVAVCIGHHQHAAVEEVHTHHVFVSLVVVLLIVVVFVVVVVVVVMVAVVAVLLGSLIGSVETTRQSQHTVEDSAN